MATKINPNQRNPCCKPPKRASYSSEPSLDGSEVVGNGSIQLPRSLGQVNTGDGTGKPRL